MNDLERIARIVWALLVKGGIHRAA